MKKIPHMTPYTLSIQIRGNLSSMRPGHNRNLSSAEKYFTLVDLESWWSFLKDLY